jgi:hypothetical protein
VLFKRNVHVLKMVETDGDGSESGGLAEESPPNSPDSTPHESEMSLHLPVIDDDIQTVLTEHYNNFRKSMHKNKVFAKFGEMFSFIAKMMFNETAHFNFQSRAENRKDEFFQELINTVGACLQKVNGTLGIELPTPLDIQDAPPYIFIFSLFIDAETYLKTEIGFHEKQTSSVWKNGFAKYLIKETFKKCVIGDSDKSIIESFFNTYRIEEMPSSDLKHFIVCLQLLKCLRKDKESTNPVIFDDARPDPTFNCKQMILHLFEKVQKEYSSDNFNVLQHEIMDHCARFLNMFPMLVSSGLKVGNMTTSEKSEFYGIVDTDQILTCDIVVNVNMRDKPAASPGETGKEDAATCSYVVFYPENIVDDNAGRVSMIKNIESHIFSDLKDVVTMHDHLYFLRPNFQSYPVEKSKVSSQASTKTYDTHLSNATQYGFHPSCLKGWYNNDDMREMLVTIVHEKYPSKVYGISINDKIISELAVTTVENGGEVAGSTSSEESVVV